LALAGLVVVLVLAGTGDAFAQGASGSAEETSKGEETSRAIPRFVSLASSEVNVRTGPGEQYPVTWKFVRQGLPVEVVAEYELWRRIRAQDGTIGWVHKSLLSGRRTAVIVGATRLLHADPDAASPVVVQAQAGVQGRLRKCHGSWCEMEISGHKGWLTRDQIWGVYPTEALD
jgi:SH3-like domain-containing protein